MADRSAHEGSVERVLTRSLFVRGGWGRASQYSPVCSFLPRSPPAHVPPALKRTAPTPSALLVPPAFSAGFIWLVGASV